MKTLVYVCLLLLVSSIASATTYVVRPDGTGDFPTIQAAIDACVDGDVVELTDGTFTGEGNRDIDYLGKAITVRSQSGNVEACIIDCTQPWHDRAFYFHTGEQVGSILQGVTLLSNGGGSSPPPVYGVIQIEDAGPTIRDCVVTSPMYLGSSGLYVSGSSSPFVENCRISNYEIAVCCGWTPSAIALTLNACIIADNHYGPMMGWGGGIVFHGESLVVSDCVFARNTATGHGGSGGAFVVWAGDVAVSGCTIADNGGNAAGPAIWLYDARSFSMTNTTVAFGTGAAVFGSAGSVSLNCCDIYGNEGGDWVGEIAGQYGINGNISEDPLFCDMANDDFTIDAASPCAPEHSGGCGLIGALPVGCAGTAVEPTTWGAIKASFR
jgi:hypothetical protein